MENVKAFFGAGEHLTDEGVALYVDALKLGTLDQLPTEIRAHVAACNECKTNVTGLFALLDSESYADVRTHPSFTLEHGVGSSYLGVMKLAAVIAGLALIGALMYFWNLPGHIRSSAESPQEVLRQGADSARNSQQTHPGPQGGSNPEFAANFIADPDLEHLVNSRYRSSGISVVSPLNESVVDSGALFIWKGRVRGHVRLCIMTNSGSIKRDDYDAKSPSTLKQHLNPGLYYWKIESEDELLYAGKFFVR